MGKYMEVGNIQGKVANILQVQPDLMAQAVGGDIQDATMIPAQAPPPPPPPPATNETVPEPVANTTGKTFAEKQREKEAEELLRSNTPLKLEAVSYFKIVTQPGAEQNERVIISPYPKLQFYNNKDEVMDV